MQGRGKRINYAEVESDEDLDDQQKQLEWIKRDNNGRKKGGDTYGTTRKYLLLSIDRSQLDQRIGTDSFLCLFVTQLVETRRRRSEEETQDYSQLEATRRS
jgi:hypothetical protein